MHNECDRPTFCAIRHSSVGLQAPPLQILSNEAQLKEMACGLLSDSDADAGIEATAATAVGTQELSVLKAAKTKKDRAREARRKAHEKALADKRALKEQRRNVDNCKQLAAEIEDQEKEQEMRRLRLQVRCNTASAAQHDFCAGPGRHTL